MADESGKPRYSRDEVEEILLRAAERTHADGGDGLSHVDLVEAAREAGIDVGAVEEAVGELALQRQERKAIEVWEARRRRGFRSHLMTWLVVNAGLFLLNLVGGGVWWFLWPLLGWGIAVALHATRALSPATPDQIERVTRRERRRIEADRKRERRRLAREELRDKYREARARRKGTERQFEAAVEAGVSALLEVVGKRIDAATGRDRRPLADTEFNRYVTRKRNGPTPPAPRTNGDGAATGPRVRVQDREDARDRAREEAEDEDALAERGRGRRDGR